MPIGAQRRCSESGEAKNGLRCRRMLAPSDSLPPGVECDVNTSSSSNEARRCAEHTYFDDDAEPDCEATCSSSVLADISTNHISTENVHKPKSLSPRRAFKRKRLSSKGSEILDVSSSSTVSKKSQPTKKRRKRRISSVTEKGNVGEEERENFSEILPKELVADVKRYVIDHLFSSPLLLKLSMLDESWAQLCTEQLKRSKRNGSMVEITRFFRNENPFVRTFVEEDGNIHAKSFHNDVRLLVRMLRYLLESKWRGGDEGSSFMLDGFTPNALGWLCLYSEEQLPRCPLVLQEKIRDLIVRDFPRTSNYVYSPAFLKPEMFGDVLAFRRDVMTSLNLGELQLHGRPLIKPIFPCLRELIWHKADMFELARWNTPELTVLSVTASSSSMIYFDVVVDRPKLEYLYTGLKVPDDPTRFDLDVLLRSYQAFWNTPVVEAKREHWGGGNEPVYVISAIPNVRRIAFWNAPEKLFALMAKNNTSFDTVQFGQLNQALTRLCSLDSIMQALFKFNQPKYECYKLEISHLKMYLHAMPVVSLDYYLPQLMMGINDAMTSIKSLDLFVHCSFSASMPTSWVLEGRQKNSCSKLKNLTHFSLHIDGFCVFDDLDCHLPPSLTCVSVSVSLPVIGARRSLSSLMDLVKRLANVNAYPDLEELHLQVWGIRCAEQLLNHVADNLSDVRRLSIIAMPLSEQRDRLIDLIRHVASSCSRLVSLQLSVEMMLILVKKYGDLWKHSWRLAIARVAAECGMRDTCDFGVNSLPHVSDCDEYIVKPSYPELQDSTVELGSYGVAESEDEMESREDDAEDSDSCSNDSFVVESDDVDSDGEDDELDLLDQQLESETDRRHERYVKKQSRVLSVSSEEGERHSLDDDDGSDVEYITDYEDEEEEQQNPLIDGEAEEVDTDEESEESIGTESDGEDIEHSRDEGMLDGEAEEVESGMESEDGSDTEPEGEDAAFSSDQEMLEAAAEMVNARPRRNQGKTLRKKHIIVSDSE